MADAPLLRISMRSTTASGTVLMSVNATATPEALGYEPVGAPGPDGLPPYVDPESFPLPGEESGAAPLTPAEEAAEEAYEATLVPTDEDGEFTSADVDAYLDELQDPEMAPAPEMPEPTLEEMQEDYEEAKRRAFVAARTPPAPPPDNRTPEEKVEAGDETLEEAEEDYEEGKAGEDARAPESGR